MKRLPGSTIRWLCAASILAAAGHAAAQGYPVKPIRMIVPSAPGGSVDTLARIVAQKMTESLGQQVIVENRSGSGGVVGTELVAKAAPDGYTLLMAYGSHVINPSLYRKLPYETVRDFAPITQVAVQPLMVNIHPSLPARTVKELIALARKRPGEVFFASGGTGSSVHLAAALFLTTARVEMTHVPYKGGGPAMTGVLSGEASVMFPTMQSVMPLVRTGRLRALAISITTRSPALPEIPTIAEAGVPGYDATGWYGMLAPAGTPEAAIDRLHAGVVKILAAPELKQRLAAEGAIAVGNTPAQFDRFIRDEIGKWAKIIRELKLRVD